MVGERTMKTKLCSVVILVLLAAAATARAAPPDARGAVVHLPAQDLDALRREVAQARARDARPFAEVGRLVALAPELDARARARKAPVALYLAKLGPDALMPALEMLAIDPPHGVPEAAVPSIRRALIEAVGMLRDPRALRVLFAVLDDTGEDADTTRTATEAIARIGTEAAAEKIVATLGKATSVERARAVIGGMGECRRLRVTEALAEQLRTTNDEATARAAARALGRAGNAWVWPTLGDRSEEGRIRETAARALVDAFVRHDGDIRTAASNALMVVDAPRTPALIAEARKTAPRETAIALDALAARLARNPARSR